ncbi:hypothetical protein NQ318_003977 [Aromia moschata]|uniref:Mos1 transposase HTH domain-containing protein n=1 Tax=Aromia moschata TaxID=1265417 RepID=A0AAV8Z9N3_9CUCU|nr:hypothetical protein NQ318_003977 [Aromia moschata]
MYYKSWALKEIIHVLDSKLKENLVRHTFEMEQRVNFNFLVKLGKTFTEAYATLKEVYVSESRIHVSEWFKRFKEGRETTEDDQHPGRLSA